MNTEIITIGDEILIGQIVDTNSAWMATELNKIGVSVSRINSIPDRKAAIIETMEAALERTDLVLITGGLGPTNDDITKQTLSDYFGCKLCFHEEAYESIKMFIELRGSVFNDMNKSQAMLPDCAHIFVNEIGTAAGMWFEKSEKVVVSMPGVPFEMEKMMQDSIIPKIVEYFDTPGIYHKTVLTSGMSEAVLAEKIADWEAALPEYIRLAYLPSPGINKLRLSSFGEDIDSIKSDVNSRIVTLREIIGEYIWGYDDESLESLAGEILSNINATLAVAESCTGGNIARAITSVPGCSAYFKGGVVAYSNEVKMNQLGVESEALQRYGAVSEAVVKQMAAGVCKLMGTDYGIATSGIAGPGGGSDEKPVGTVWIAVATPDEVSAQGFRFGNRRDNNITRSTVAALFMFLKKLKKENKQ